MDRNFSRSLALVLKSEGGWSDNSADPGGATMKGVTLATFRAFIKPDGTKADLRAITDAQLSTVYRREYWDAISGDQLPDGVDYAVFDFAVNSGPSRAARYLQSAAGVTMDGAIGPATLAAVAAKPAGVIIDHLCDMRLSFLQRLPTWGTFGKGWQSRVESVRRAAIAMTAPQGAAPVQAPTAPKPAAPPVTAPVQVQKPPKPHVEGSGIVASVVAALALTAMAVSGLWHHVTQFVSSFF